MTLPLRTYILVAGLLWSALLFAAPPAANAGTILGAPTYLGLGGGLVGWWSFNGNDLVTDGSGTSTAYDRSGQGNHGTLYNGTQKTLGKLGQALSFDGVNDWVQILDSANLTPASNITLAAWFNASSVQPDPDNAPNIIGKANGDGYFFEIDEAGADCGVANALCAGFRIGGNWRTVKTPAALTFDRWHHAVATYNNVDIILYVDGVVVDSIARSGAITHNTQDLCIGADTGDSGDECDQFPFHGSIDDVRVYNRALSPDEIKRLYNIGGTLHFGRPNSSGSLSQGLVGWWTMDGNDTSKNNGGLVTVLDRSGNGNKGSSVSAAATPALTPGKIGQGMTFDGVDDYLNANSDSSLDDLVTKSVCAWVKAAAGSDGMIISKNTNNEDTGWLIHVSNSPTLANVSYFQGRGSSNNGEWRTGASTFTYGAWQHVCATYDGSIASNVVVLYINGISKALTELQSPGGVQDDGANQDVLIGRVGGGPAVYFTGNIDDVRIYNRIISANEVKRIYKIGSTLKQGAPNSTGSLSNGLVGWWTFDGNDTFTNNKTLDRSGNNNTGDLINGPQRTIGKIGQALVFDGTNDYVDVGSGASIGNVTRRTISAWIYPRTLGASNFGTPIGTTQGSNFWYIQMCNNSASECNNKVSTFVYFHVGAGGNGEWAAPANTIKLNAWQHIVVEYDCSSGSNVALLFYNGAQVVTTQESTPGTPTCDDSSLNKFIGASDNGPSNEFDGTIDDVRMYNRFLSPDEIKRLYNMGR